MKSNYGRQNQKNHLRDRTGLSINIFPVRIPVNSVEWFARTWRSMVLTIVDECNKTILSYVTKIKISRNYTITCFVRNILHGTKIRFRRRKRNILQWFFWTDCRSFQGSVYTISPVSSVFLILPTCEGGYV